MSSINCEIIGKGDYDPYKICKENPSISHTIAAHMVSEVIDTALEIVDDLQLNLKIRKGAEKDIVEGQHSEIFCEKEKIKSKPSIGTGDQKSDQEIITQEEAPLFEHPPIEKKNRLTDLVKNSKYVWSKLIFNSTTNMIVPQEDLEENLVDVIELDCVQISDLPLQTAKNKETLIPRPSTSYSFKEEDTLVPLDEESLDEIKLSVSPEVSRTDSTLKRRTFPLKSALNAKANFVAKCRTLREGATNLKKKKWSVRGKIANFFRRTKCNRGNKVEKKENNDDNDETLVEKSEMVEEIKKELRDAADEV